jgi:RNA polymerase sigma-70 factor (ECF subfamily)
VTDPLSAPAFAELFEASKDRVYQAVFLAVRNPARAEDAVAEAYCRAWARWDSLSAHPNATGWLIRTALNAARDDWRIWRREQPNPPELAAVSNEGGADDQGIVAMIWSLPRRQREVLALRVILDLSERDTAGILRIAPGTVSAHLHRAIGSLRAAFVAQNAHQPQESLT